MLAYIAFALAPVTRAERVESHRERVMQGLDYTQREFLGFVLDHYLQHGIADREVSYPGICLLPLGRERPPGARLLTGHEPVEGNEHVEYTGVQALAVGFA